MAKDRPIPVEAPVISAQEYPYLFCNLRAGKKVMSNWGIKYAKKQIRKTKKKKTKMEEIMDIIICCGYDLFLSDSELLFLESNK